MDLTLIEIGEITASAVADSLLFDIIVVMRRVAKCRVAGRDGYWKSGRGSGRVPMIPTRVFAFGYPGTRRVVRLRDYRGIT